jgi:hypothetical protein
MNEFEADELSIGTSEGEIIHIPEAPLEYCDVCFIALGSQEKRVHKGQKKFHPDCEAKANF